MRTLKAGAATASRKLFKRTVKLTAEGAGRQRGTDYRRAYPATVNAAETDRASACAAAVNRASRMSNATAGAAGPARILPSCWSARPVYLFFSQRGAETRAACPCIIPATISTTTCLPIGANYLAAMVEQELA